MAALRPRDLTPLQPREAPKAGQGPSPLCSDTAGQTREGKSRKRPVSGRRQPLLSPQAAWQGPPAPCPAQPSGH